MACNTLSLVAATSTASTLGLAASSSAFVGTSPSPSMLAPVSSTSSVKPLAVACSASARKETSAQVRNTLLTGLVAAGAALSVFTSGTVAPVQAAVGPGGSGAERTAQKAQDLLKQADKLNVDDAPQRFGPGRVKGSAEEAGKTAQKAGGKALSQLKGGISDVATNFRGDLADLQGAAEDAASQVRSGIDQATDNTGGGLFGSIRQGLQGLKDEIENKDAEAKKTYEEAASKAESAAGDVQQSLQ